MELAKKMAGKGAGITSAWARKFPKTGPFQALALKASLATSFARVPRIASTGSPGATLN